MEYTGTLKSIKGRLVEFELSSDLDIEKVERNAVGRLIQANIGFQNKNMITDDQRKKIFALINDICEHTGYMNDEMYIKMKFYYMAYSGCDVFSISRNGVPKEFASRFIEFIIEWCFQMGVPFMNRDYHLSSDENRTLFIYLKYRSCFVCGKQHSDVHHVNGSTIGMGGNRKKVQHIGRYVMCLCREHHTQYHVEGESKFLSKHHLIPIKLTDELVKSLKLGGKINE